MVKAKKEREKCMTKHSRVENASFTILACAQIQNDLNESCISENLPFFSLRHTTHVQINHAETSAARRIPVLMEEHAPSCATTPNKSSTAHARLDMLEDSVRRKVLHLASSYNSKQRSPKILLYTPCMTPKASLSTKPSVILLLKMDSFGLCSSPSA